MRLRSPVTCSAKRAGQAWRDGLARITIDQVVTVGVAPPEASRCRAMIAASQIREGRRGHGTAFGRRDSSAQRSSPRRHAADRCDCGSARAAFAIASLAAPIDDLRTAVEAGDSAAAYARHCATSIDAPERPPEFDLWCGVAAVDIGRSGEGVLALERYVLQFPDDARAPRAGARLFLRRRRRPRRAKNSKRVRQKPAAAGGPGRHRSLSCGARPIARPAIAAGARRSSRSAAGYDSNASAGVAQAAIGLPVLGPVTVDASASKRVGVRMAGGRRRNPPSPSAGLTVNASVYGGRHVLRVGVGTSIWRVTARALGASYRADRNEYSLAYAHGEIALDGIALPLGRRHRLRVAPRRSPSCLRSRLRRNTRASATTATTPHAMPI